MAIFKNAAEAVAYAEAHMKVQYAENSDCYKSGRTIQPNGSVNHSTGCAQPKASVFRDGMNKSGAGWGVNAVLGDFHLGDGVILVTMPLNRRPWGCGSGSKGSWNNSRIQWEVCEPAGHTYAGGTMVNYDAAKNSTYFSRMWKMLVAWNVYCCVKFGFKPDSIADHAESYKSGYGSNHCDMSHWLPKHNKSMDMLRTEVKEILQAKEEEEMITQAEFEKMYAAMMAKKKDNDSSGYSEDARKWATENGIIQGSGTLPNGQPNFMWEDLMTREQFVTMLYRYHKNFISTLSIDIQTIVDKVVDAIGKALKDRKEK